MQFADEWLVPTVEPLVKEADIAALRDIKVDEPLSLWETLVQRKVLTDEQILSAVARRFHLAIADVSQVDSAVREEVPESLVRKFNILPIRVTDSFLEVATANPFDMDAEKMLAFATGREVRMLICSPNRIRERLDELYQKEDVVSKLLEGMTDEVSVTALTEEDEDFVSADEAAQRPIIRLVDTMLADGVASRASDIHVEPVEGGVVVRYRIDGVLRQVMKIPRAAGIPLISRIKIMGGMDIADRLRPQDGRARVAVNGNPVDLRISTLPASLGEKVVIRILNTRATVLALDSLGFDREEQDTIERLLHSKEGIVLVTGPTGSGKTTTLYASLRVVQNEGVNIVTVEDPVEYRLGANIVQVQVNEKAGLTFASALRSILRQDPDVVLVGEVRDQETAQIATQAALTGHLVLSTLHTNDAPNSVTRLLDMGMEAYKIASALRGIVAQRLLRQLCPVCKEVMDTPLPQYMRRFVPEKITLYKAVGCKECANTGFRGRFAITEIMVMTPELEALIGSGATADRITIAARSQGMRSLFESGLRHLLRGNTSVEELLRVTDIPSDPVRDKNRAEPPAKPGAKGASEAVAETPVAGHAPGHDVAFDLIDEPLDLGERDGKGTILLVEDEDQLRRVMKDLLEREGYAIVEAADGVQALEQVDRHNPDVILLDLNLPGMDGYGVLQHLRSRPGTSTVPVIVLTAKGDEDNEVRVLKLGADDFLTKPFRARALSARLESVISRRRSAR
ncbi:MAG TPA: type II/IV secretion system protein [Gemmatimonadales bacterium]|nr:type II/IV secretion system protein [Gemmatimonadales bacterium]